MEVDGATSRFAIGSCQHRIVVPLVVSGAEVCLALEGQEFTEVTGVRSVVGGSEFEVALWPVVG